jgi:ABC-type nickel/cobalt efflux system permease component RcnA
MKIFGLVWFGLFLGMTHAMDANHIAAISAMWNRQSGQHRLIRRWLDWGAGHGIALLALCMVLLSAGQVLSDQKQALLEPGANLLILYLGAQFIWRMYRRRIHEHVGKCHLHMHSHLNDHSKSNATIPHDELAHDHKHANKSPFLALMVGLVHGTAF